MQTFRLYFIWNMKACDLYFSVKGSFQNLEILIFFSTFTFFFHHCVFILFYAFSEIFLPGSTLYNLTNIPNTSLSLTTLTLSAVLQSLIQYIIYSKSLQFHYFPFHMTQNSRGKGISGTKIENIADQF